MHIFVEKPSKKEVWGSNVYFNRIFIAKNVLGHTDELITKS